MTDDEMMAAVRRALADRQARAGQGQGIQVGVPRMGGGDPLPGMPGMQGGPTGAGLMPPTMGGLPPHPAPQLGSLIGQQPGGMGGPGGITATPLAPPTVPPGPPPGMPQSPMTPATPMGGPMATGGGLNSLMGAPAPQPRPFVPFGQSSNLADYFSQPRPAGTAGMAPQQARQGVQMGPPAPTFGQTHYLADWIARMFGRG